MTEIPKENDGIFEITLKKNPPPKRGIEIKKKNDLELFDRADVDSIIAEQIKHVISLVEIHSHRFTAILPL